MILYPISEGESLEIKRSYNITYENKPTKLNYTKRKLLITRETKDGIIVFKSLKTDGIYYIFIVLFYSTQ